MAAILGRQDSFTVNGGVVQVAQPQPGQGQQGQQQQQNGQGLVGDEEYK